MVGPSAVIVVTIPFVDCLMAFPAARMGATTVEISTNHVAMVPRPDEVLQLIRSTVEAVAGVT